MEGLPFSADSDEIHLLDSRHLFKPIGDGEKPRFFQTLAEFGDVGGENDDAALAECHIMEPTIIGTVRLKCTRVSCASEVKMTPSC